MDNTKAMNLILALLLSGACKTTGELVATALAELGPYSDSRSYVKASVKRLMAQCVIILPLDSYEGLEISQDIVTVNLGRFWAREASKVMAPKMRAV